MADGFCHKLFQVSGGDVTSVPPKLHWVFSGRLGGGVGTNAAACGLQPEGVTTMPALKSQQAVECQACTINLHMTSILLSVC